MTATLTFTLPEEAREHQLAVNGALMAGAICDTLETTRSWLKHGHDFKTPEEAIAACRDLLVDVADVARGDSNQ